MSDSRVLPIDQIKSLFAKYPTPKNTNYSYGTAGFRKDATTLPPIAFKIGILAGLRSLSLGGKTIGVMITASHNPPEDNGVKIVDPLGEMLPQNWEPLATDLANAFEFDDYIKVLTPLWDKYAISNKCNMVIARDTRESGPLLVQACIDGLKCLSCGDIDVKFEDFGEMTTPQLHYITRCFNDSTFGDINENGYYLKLFNAVKEIMKINHKSMLPNIVVDCANGIGGDKLIKLQKYLENYFQLDIINNESKNPRKLNVNCGADFVKTNQILPNGLLNPIKNQLYCSFDGDADRIVFYFVDNDGVFKLLDGDRIATLLAEFIGSLINKVGGLKKLGLSIGIVQTAYANGSSTKHIENDLKLPVVFTPTGVKHLHHRATDFDIGIYFEANGHGTVLFSENYIETFEKQKEGKNNEVIQTLLLLVKLINQTVGDSISDLLAVLVALTILEKSAEDWFNEYTELPNKLFKVTVKDRSAFKTTDAERKLVEPEGLQTKIEETMAAYNKGRSFVRASGTEDAVRVYSEASTKKDCVSLGEQVCLLVCEFS